MGSIVNFDLENANFVAADLEQARLYKTNLKNSDCYGANFKHSICEGTDFEGADIRTADFERATLFEANLKKACAINTNFKKCIMHRINIKHANIAGANFDSAAVLGIRYNRNTSFMGARMENCYGDAIFKRFAQDQDFLETFKQRSRYKFLYWPWLIFMDCGRSFALWAFWSVIFALIFGSIYDNFLGIKTIQWLPGWVLDLVDSISPDLKNISRTSFTPYYFSVVTFTTLGFGDITPLDKAGEIWVTIEVVLGYIMLGGLISILANKIARRS
jgi:uncharacterized protein YjbI with pentapeptide repeats